MKLIKLTTKGKTFFVNTDKITVIAEHSLNVGTPYPCDFDETQDQVLALIAEATA